MPFPYGYCMHDSGVLCCSVVGLFVFVRLFPQRDRQHELCYFQPFISVLPRIYSPSARIDHNYLIVPLYDCSKSSSSRANWHWNLFHLYSIIFRLLYHIEFAANCDRVYDY